MIRRDRSLRVRLIAWLAALSFVAGVALVGATWLYGRRAADSAYDRILLASALAIAEQVYVRNDAVSVDLPYASLDMLGFARDDRVFYRIADTTGETVTGYNDVPSPPESVSGDPVFYDAEYSGDTVRFVALGRLLTEPDVKGWATVQVGQTRQARQALAREIAYGAMGPIAVALGIMLVLVWIGVTRGLRPLHRIEQELTERKPSDLSPLTVAAPSEIYRLVSAMNDFMGRLQSSFAQMQQFIADGAHQIRTPLASLRAQAEIARDEPDPQQMRRLLARIDSNAQSAARLTNQLLSNAMVAHRANVREHTEFDLTDVLHQALREAIPVADGGPERIDVSITTDGTTMVGDAVAVREAIRNLVENARQHGDTEHVSVELHRTETGFACCVADRGPGIPDDDIARVLQRFERGAHASEPGSGLGLAIVKQVAQQHNGALTLENREGGGLVATLYLQGDPR